MRHRCVRAAVAAAMVAVVVGCRSVPDFAGAPPVAAIGGDRADAKMLETGRSIYVGRCTYCHAPQPIDDYEADDWSGRILPLMTKRAKLSRAEAEALGLYVLTARAATPSALAP